jgi:hypothetical protein
MPALQRLHEQLGERGLSVIAVSVDSEGLGLGGGDADVRSFINEFGLTFTVLRDASGRIDVRDRPRWKDPPESSGSEGVGRSGAGGGNRIPSGGLIRVVGPSRRHPTCC